MQSSSTTLRLTTLADLDFVLSVENHEDNRAFVTAWTHEQHAAAVADPNIAHFIITRSDGTSLGYAIVAGLDNPSQSLELRRIAVAAKGKGHGKRALQWLMHYAFTESGAHRLWLDMKEHNMRARQLYTLMGFVVEGTLRECLLSDGHFESLVIMSLLSHEYRNGN